jgi:hypothetical protein
VFLGPCHFGSYDDTWLFLAYGQTRRHRLLNICTRESHELLDVLADNAGGEIHSIVVLTATLSFPPHHSECVTAGIVTYQPDLDAPRRRHFTFWHPADEVAIYNVVPTAPVGSGLE